jgi:hypothetical protein
VRDASVELLELVTRPEHPDLTAALARRWEELPDHVKTPNQMLGRRTAGCEGTHGVFPRCNLACTPCYHSRDANRVRVDGAHTLREVDSQMAYLREQRGPGQNAQLIGGEVSLLPPDDHAAVLLSMIRHGRKPMSMSHGDFDYEYLEALALDPATGEPRLRHLSFAGHFDSMMFGRRGIKRPENEAALNPYRQRFCEMFQRLEREHGITHYLAHNMTVTPGNIDEVPQVLRDCRDMGFRTTASSPPRRSGAGSRRAPARACTRMRSRSATRAATARPTARIRGTATHRSSTRTTRATRGCSRTSSGPSAGWTSWRPRRSWPRAVVSGAGWARRFVARAGGARAVARERPRAVTYVMHAFMDAEKVKPAWEGLRRGEISDDPAIRETQERLQACSYAMSHPESDELVPACAQHSVLDPMENVELTRLLPMAPAPAPAPA